MPGPDGSSFYVDFGWHTLYRDDGDTYHPVWPAFATRRARVGPFGVGSPTSRGRKSQGSAPTMPLRHTALPGHAAVSVAATAHGTKSCHPTATCRDIGRLGLVK